jgi:starch phosphorylase
LALDIHSAWNHTADRVWQQLDPTMWDLTHNPWVILQTVSRQNSA